MADELNNNEQANIGEIELPIDPVYPEIPSASWTEALKEQLKAAIIAELKAESIDLNSLEEADTLKGFTSLPAMQGTALKRVPLTLLTDLTDEEYIKRLQGISEHSNSMSDPFAVLPGSSDGKGLFLTMPTLLECLDLLVPDTDGANAYKTCGYFRGTLDGVPVIVYNLQRNFATQELTQFAMGPFKLDEEGNVTWNANYNIIKRIHAEYGWGKWEVLKLLTTDEVAEIKDMQGQIAKINTKIENSDTIADTITDEEIDGICGHDGDGDGLDIDMPGCCCDAIEDEVINNLK